MSAETTTWLNQMTLIGFTEKRGNAWHYKESKQGDEPNHYTGAIPIEDVERRLFQWDAVEGQVSATVMSEDGVYSIADPSRKAIIRPAGSLSADDKGGILGVFKSSYCIHQYREWLLNQIAAILDDDLCIGSAGLLRMGGQAWVSVEVPDNIVTPSGVVFRPNLLAATSHDGTLATSYQRAATNVVCDNTMAAAMREKTTKFRVRHTRNSYLRLNDARQALEIIHTVADDFMKQVEELTNITVSEGDWTKFLDSINPIPTEDGRGKTIAMNKRDKLTGLWAHDDRVAPWANTAWGVVQAVNTYEHHLSRGSSNVDRLIERNMQRAISGKVNDLDGDTVKALEEVLALA